MSRLTSEPFRRKLDDSSENYKVRRYGREEWETLAQNAINKLGKLEDLMDEYNINSIEQLENTLSSKFIAGGFRSSGKTIVAKGMLYNILSEELGCPLEVVFKALEEGIVINEEGYVNSAYDDKEFNAKEDSHYNCLTLSNYLGNGYYFEDIRHPYGDPECGDIGCLVKLSDYQKTWWLKGEENEKCTILN